MSSCMFVSEESVVDVVLADYYSVDECGQFLTETCTQQYSADCKTFQPQGRSSLHCRCNRHGND